MIRFSLKKLPLQRKLLVYFLVFGAIILVILWAFQSFFVKPLYTIDFISGAECILDRILPKGLAYKIVGGMYNG